MYKNVDVCIYTCIYLFILCLLIYRGMKTYRMHRTFAIYVSMYSDTYIQTQIFAYIDTYMYDFISIGGQAPFGVNGDVPWVWDLISSGTFTDRNGYTLQQYLDRRSSIQK